MTQERDAVLTFGILIACGGAMTAAAGIRMWIGYMVGVILTPVAAAIAGADFE